MRFLAFFWLLTGRKRNGGPSAAADQGGAGEGIKPQAVVKLPGQPEHQQKGTVQLFRRLRVDATNNPPNAVATERDQLICHDLRAQAKAVPWGNFDYRSERKSVLQIRRNRADEDCRKAGREIIALNDNAGPRPPQIARDDHQHDIATRYFHESQS
jgi:hypothetical protein